MNISSDKPKKKTLENNFADSTVIKALNDGYTQGEIARYLGLVVGRHLTLKFLKFDPNVSNVLTLMFI